MFDLDEIEQYWKENSVYLSNEEIREIYIAEGVTTKEYSRIMEDFYNNLPKPYKNSAAAEQKLLESIFFSKEEQEKENKRLAGINKARQEMLKKKPKRPCLSHESQMKVVEGSLDIVFNSARAWHDAYEKLSLEDLYYEALEGLFTATKLCVHYVTKNSFRAYAEFYIRMQITKYIAKKEHLSYRNVYCIYSHCFDEWNIHSEENRATYSIQEFSFDYDKETPYKPSCIYEMIEQEYATVPDYTRGPSLEEFRRDYSEALHKLAHDEFMVMSLSYDEDGNPGLTYAEIGEFLGIEAAKVKSIKRRAKHQLAKLPEIKRYKY